MPKNRLQYKAMPYLKDFKCTCGDCPDSCCIGWDVDIDQETYARYMALKEPHLVKRYQKLIKPYPYYFDTAVDFARVKLPHSKRCPFLTEKGLCMTQSELGEAYLSNVCATFPRISNQIDDVIETTLTLSCPVAAELVLLGDSPLVLETVAAPSRQIVNLRINTQEKGYKQHPVRHFHGIRRACLALIQREDLDFARRIYALGLFFEDLSDCQARGDLKGIEALCALEDLHYLEGDLKPDFYDISLANAMAAQFLDLCLTQLDVFGSVDSKSFVQYTRRLQSQLSQDKKAKKTDPLALGRSRSVYMDSFGKTRGQLLTRYTVNYIIKNGFPFVDSDNLMEAYGMLVIRLCLIDLYAAGLYEADGLTDVSFAAFIQSFAKTVEHHKVFSEGMLATFKDNDWFNLLYLGQLLTYA